MPHEGWTVDTLHDHFMATITMLRGHLGELRQADSTAVAAALAAAEKAVAAALAAAEKATLVAEETNREWRKGSNEWRGALDDRERAAIAALEKFASREALAASVAALQVQLDDLKKSTATSTGRAGGVNASWAYLGGGAGIVGVLWAIFANKP